MQTELKTCLGDRLPVGETGLYWQVPDLTLDPDAVRAIMINEVVPGEPAEDFYGEKGTAGYLSTVLPLFKNAGAVVDTVEDITAKGIYMTNAVKVPKGEYTIPKERIEASVPLLERELGLFHNLQVVMLMGDVAKKAFNLIAKRHTKQAAIPAGSTYKQRGTAFYYEGMRVFPSYIMTGGNILIEKSKFTMASEDIAKMLSIIE